MDVQSKIDELRSIIDKSLIKEIDNDYVLCGLPVFPNIGDMLITQGTLDFLEKKIKYKCLDYFFYNDYHLGELDPNTIILIRGGGYFGDIWRFSWQQVVDTVRAYPNNKIIILSQSIHYLDDIIARQDVEVFSRNKKLVICSRDMDSYIVAKSLFANKCLLVPDFAFYMDPKYYKLKNEEGNNVLYLKRQDKEFVPNAMDYSNMDISDWPPMAIKNKTTIQKVCERAFYYYHRIISKYPKMRYMIKPFIYKLFFFQLYRPMMIKEGVQFINRYQKIFTTRLHGMILSVMMNKNVVFIDNSYGKVSSYYKTWLTNLDNLNPIEM